MLLADIQPVSHQPVLQCRRLKPAIASLTNMQEFSQNKMLITGTVGTKLTNVAIPFKHRSDLNSNKTMQKGGNI